MWSTDRFSIAPFLRNEINAVLSIELKHLRYAEVAERCGSFRKAADSLSLKQSNLSRRVRHLEEELGVSLFERTNGGVRPTSAGRDFINGVRRVLNELQIVVDGAKAVGRGEAGYLTIGFYTSLSAGNLRASLVEYASAATVGSSMLVVDAINERAAAFYEGNGFVRLPESLRLVLPMHAIQRLVEP